MALKNLCNEVEFLAQYPEIGMAISDSTSPIPGYLFGEITSITFINYGKNCKPLVNFLISRLEANTPLIGMKVLELLLHLVKNGFQDMIEEVKFHEIALKEAMAFHGPPDDFHGKTFYENIRKMAKELLEYVFSENKDTRDNFSPPLQSELTGYGSNASVKKLPGFGFSVKTQKSVSDKMSEGIVNFVEKLLPSSDGASQSAQTSLLSEGLPQYKPLTIERSILECEVEAQESTPSSVPKASVHPRIKPKTSVYKPGRPGGGWDDSEDEEEVVNDPIVESASKHSSESVDSVDFSKIDLKEVSADWLEERKVVEEFAVDEDLNKMDFDTTALLCKRCSSLNCDKILSLLIEKLSDKRELVQLRALLLIEYLIFHDILTLDPLLKIVTPPLTLLYEKENGYPKSVKIKAKKICLIIRNLNLSVRHRQQLKQPTEKK